MNKKIEQLQQIQADASVFYIKLHNYHWNVKGMQFHPVHLTTEELYTQFATLFDDVAERILQVDGAPLVSMKQLLAKANIEEDENNDFRAADVLSGIRRDFEYFIAEFKTLKSVADEDVVTAAYADEQLAYLEKAMWMLNAQLAE